MENAAMGMIWKELLAWALKTAETDVKEAGIKALQQVASEFAAVIGEHAPDMQPVIDPLLQQAVTSAVAGITTKED